MKINTNNWNKIRYALYAPVYDLAGRIFQLSRKKAIAALNIQPGDKVLLVGAGTGLDLEFLPASCKITATDLTPTMVRRIKARNKTLKLNIDAMVMDGHQLLFNDQTFDKVILHLILAVIPDPIACLREAERVLKPGGRVSVFDKLVPKNHKVTFLRKLLNPLVNFFFSDITRHIEPIVAQTGLKIIADHPANFHGNFRIVLLEKTSI